MSDGQLVSKSLKGGYALKNKAMVFLVSAFFLMILASAVNATDFRTETFALTGTGSFMDSPPVFIGTIISGTLSPGTFWIRFDDTGWPVDDPGTPNNERWDYIFSHYFAYDSTAGTEGWDGYFPPTGSGEIPPKWRFYTAAGDTLGGSCNGLTITIRDYNADGVLQDSEYHDKVISSNLTAYINYSGGCFNSFCGMGSFSGTLNITDPSTWEEELYVPSATSASGRLLLKNGGCVTGVEESSWGEIKSIYNH